MSVLVTRGDIRHLAVDAWYLPTDVDLHLAPYWRKDDVELGEAVHEVRAQPRADGWGADGVRVLPVPLPDGRRAVPVLAAIPRAGTDDWSYHRETLRQFVQLARQLDRPERTQLRARRLLAVPLIGTGNSTAFLSDRGGHVHGLLKALEEESAAAGVDIVVVLRSDDAFAAVQAVRRSAAAIPPEIEGLEHEVQRLAELARRGRLVVFTGAGAGIPAGLPDWDDLLRELASWAGVPPGLLGRFDAMAPLDRAAIVAARTSAAAMADRIAARMAVPHVSLTHSMLASLPVKENVTLNYDECFEMAARDAGAPVAVLPYEPAEDRWLLKLHGCVRPDRRDDIVLTRGDYVELGRHRASLTGLVQALLVTRHMLFVGFGLSDDHLHAVIHDVKRAVSGAGGERMGTVLLLHGDPLQEQLWKDDLHYVPVGGHGAEAARRLEIFLDQVLLLASTSDGHLFDGRYTSLLTAQERLLRDRLHRALAPLHLEESNAGRRVGELLSSMGWSDDETQRRGHSSGREAGM